MAIRKRKDRDGWFVFYTDQAGERRNKKFDTRKAAEVFYNQTKVDIRSGIHTPDTTAPTVSETASDWLKACTAQGLERSTLAQYSQHINLHIVPYIGALKLSKLTTPAVCDFRDMLLNGSVDDNCEKRSPALVKKVLTSLGSIISHAKERGKFAGSNPVRDLGRGKRARAADRKVLEIGRDIPEPSEIKRIITAKNEPLILVAIFCGLRSSELRGLRWSDVDLKSNEIHVRQRADRYNKMGPTKSRAGRRAIPVPPNVIRSLKEWKLACPKGEANLVFPSSTGAIQYHRNITRYILEPAMIAAGVVKANGSAKYGLHSLRHFFASWLINRKADGGREMPLKSVSALMGHTNISITADTYGHLFPRIDDGAELAAAEARFYL